MIVMNDFLELIILKSKENKYGVLGLLNDISGGDGGVSYNYNTKFDSGYLSGDTGSGASQVWSGGRRLC